MEKLFISIAGLIGAGKSVLTEELAATLGLPAYHEDVKGNPYLADYYLDMKSFSFKLQVYLLNNRFVQHQQIIWGGKGGVQDRTIYEDAVFAKMLKDAGLMDARDYETYINMFSNMSNFMRKPNVIIFLEVSPEQSLKRIQERGREMEKSISLEYLTALAAAYREFIKDISKVIPVIAVAWDEFHSVTEMAKKIKRVYEDLQCIRTIDWQSPTVKRREDAVRNEERAERAETEGSI